MLISSKQVVIIKYVLTGVLYYYFKFIYAYLNEGDKVWKYYSCLKMMIQANLHVGFSKTFFIKRASLDSILKWFYLYLKLLQSSTIFKQKDICVKFFTTPNSKNIFATLGIVTIEKSELTFLLMLYFHNNALRFNSEADHWLFLTQGRCIRRTTVFIFSFCIGLVTQLNGSALGALKHHYITKRIREPLIGNSRFLIYNSLNQLLYYTI